MNVHDAPGSCASTGLTNAFGKKTGSNAAFFYQDSVDETVPLRECLSANFAVSVGNMNRRLTLRRFCTQDGCAEGLKFYLLKEGIAKSRKCGTDARVHLDGNKSLKSLLKGQIIVEFPQVLVYVSGEDESGVKRTPLISVYYLLLSYYIHCCAAVIRGVIYVLLYFNCCGISSSRTALLYCTTQEIQ